MQSEEEVRLVDRPRVPRGHLKAQPVNSAASILPVRVDHCPSRHSQLRGCTARIKADALEWLRNVQFESSEEGEID